MVKLVNISDFLNYFAPHAIVTNGNTSDPPPEQQYGYVMGGDGRVADLAYITMRAKSSYPATWPVYLAHYKKWIGHQVYDCNAAAEAFYKAQTGVDINTKARLNYANWCGTKSPIAADKKLSGLPQLPGTAVFRGSKASSITHVGYLLYKYGSGPLDWYVIEFRGKDYGCVITTLTSRGWAWWGVMDKYFAYDVDAAWKPGITSGTEQPHAAPVKRTRSLKLTMKLNASGVHMRAGASTKTTIIAKLSKSTQVTYMSVSGTWTKVFYSGKAGYISSQYVTREDVLAGDDVKAVQQVLAKHGYYTGAIDGKFGPITAAAVVAYQAAKSLDVDGCVGPITWASLFA